MLGSRNPVFQYYRFGKPVARVAPARLQNLNNKIKIEQRMWKKDYTTRTFGANCCLFLYQAVVSMLTFRRTLSSETEEQLLAQQQLSGTIRGELAAPAGLGLNSRDQGLDGVLLRNRLGTAASAGSMALQTNLNFAAACHGRGTGYLDDRGYPLEATLLCCPDQHCCREHWKPASCTRTTASSCSTGYLDGDAASRRRTSWDHHAVGGRAKGRPTAAGFGKIVWTMMFLVRG